MNRNYPKWMRNGLTLATLCVLLATTSAASNGPAPVAHTAPAARAAAVSCVRPDAWQPASAMLIPRATGAAVVSNGYVFVLGGWLLSDWYEINDVESAPIGADGTLGPWVTTTPLTSINEALGAVAVNGYVYVIGGWDRSEGLSRVERAKVLAGGQLGAWEPEESLPDAYGRINLETVATGTHIYAIGGWNYSGTDVTHGVEYAAVNADGSLGPWTATSSMLIGRGSFGAVIAGPYVYVVGGNPASGVGVGLNSVERAAINADGSLGAWQEMSPLLLSGMGQVALASDGYLYAIGGASATYGVTTDSVERAAILDDGTLGPWAYVDSLLAGRSGHVGVSVNGRFYIMAGLAGTNMSDYVQVATTEQVLASDLALPSEDGMTINDGALFTNRTGVTLTISGQPGTTQMMVSNDGGFAGAEWQACVSSLPWTLTQYGTVTVARVVYLKFKDTNGVVSSTYSDDIILDVTAPSGSVQLTPLGQAASRPALDFTKVFTLSLPLIMGHACTPATCPPNVRLSLSASDDASGVGSMEIGNDAAFTGSQWEPYATSKTWYLPPGQNTVYVRFRDNAGNVSAAVTASRIK